MHSLSNRSSVRRFRIAALLFVMKWLCMSGFAVLAGYAFWTERKDLMFGSLVPLGLWVVISPALWAIAARARCPLCLVPSFSHQRCAKQRTALRIMGSCRLYVALAVLFRNHFRCPYCGEPTAMAIRSRGRNAQR